MNYKEVYYSLLREEDGRVLGVVSYRFLGELGKCSHTGQAMYE